jgi:hypothetical protein
MIVNPRKFGSIPLKDHHFGSIPLLSHLHVGPHESMTCGVHDIYLKFGSFNDIDPIVPKPKSECSAHQEKKNLDTCMHAYQNFKGKGLPFSHSFMHAFCPRTRRQARPGIDHRYLSILLPWPPHRFCYYIIYSILFLAYYRLGLDP